MNSGTREAYPICIANKQQNGQNNMAEAMNSPTTLVNEAAPKLETACVSQYVCSQFARDIFIVWTWVQP